MIVLKEAMRMYEFNSFRLDPAERLLLHDGVRVQLSPKAFETLVLLVENSGRMVGKEIFFATIWPDTIVEEGSLTVVISMLRKALGEGKDGLKYIETVSKRGYRFLADVREVRSENKKEATVRAEDCAEYDVTRSGSTMRSIAVLPFKALGAATPNQYLQMGLADAIITRLSNIRQFIVRPTSAVARYEGTRTDGFTAGRELAVDCVLDGYVQQANDRIRVTVQLVRTYDGSPIWAERFDEEFTDIFAVEDSLSERVAVTLLKHLSLCKLNGVNLCTLFGVLFEYAPSRGTYGSGSQPRPGSLSFVATPLGR